MLDNILVPIDFSAGSRAALETAIALAGRYDARLHLLHVLDEPGAVAPDRGSAGRRAAERLEEMARGAAACGVSVAPPAVATGNPFDGIAHHAVTRDVSLVVLGATGTSEDDHPLGLTAEKAIRRCAKPVWVVKGGEPWTGRRILCAVDFSEPSRRALGSAMNLARDLASALIIVHVMHPLPGSAAGGTGPDVAAARQHEARQRRALDDFLAGFDLSGLACRTQLVAGKPHAEIVRLASELGADLLVMGARMLVGSTAERVVRQLPCSVLVARAQDAVPGRVEEAIADVEARYLEGRERLKEGAPLEALSHFQHCVARDMMFAPAYEGLAEAHQQLGHAQRADECRQQAKFIHQKNWERKVEAEVRGAMWGRRDRPIESLNKPE